MRRSDIQIRDPFILTDTERKQYYLYGTTDKNCWKGKAAGFDMYISSDLEEWLGPYEAFRPNQEFWADKNYWAPEVYNYKGQYYMFASFKADGICRGTQVLVSNDPKGPFCQQGEKPVTPEEWECLDGTLYIDESNQPWMVFCREWLQVYDGEMYAVKLTNDLSSSIGEPILLFHASDAPWSKGRVHTFTKEGKEFDREVYVTDGPFLHKTSNGELLMLWSSSGREGYAIGIARSVSGDIRGPWIHDEEPLFGKDGGHGMLFRTLQGELMLTIHSPNKTPNERPIFIKVEGQDGKLSLV